MPCGGNFKMDYTLVYNFIATVGNVTNIDKPYTLYYDETNNHRVFKITDNGFNVNEHEFFFILGGIGFEPDNIASVDDINELFNAFSLQATVKEVKFNKHIHKDDKVNFLTLLSNPRITALIEWLNDKNYLIHYSYLDNFYYTTVDIVDSMDESQLLGPDFNRELKNSLYLFIRENQAEFLNFLFEMDYPNIKNHKKFVEKLIDWIGSLNVNEDFCLEYLRQSLKGYRQKQLLFLENNKDKVAIDDYSSFYAQKIITHPNAKHIFDEELIIQKKLIANPVELSGYDLDYKFVKSETERLVQVSDLIVGVISKWLSYVDSAASIINLGEMLNEVSVTQKIILKKFQEILKHSLSESTGFKHSTASNDFEDKVKFFLEYDFSQ